MWRTPTLNGLEWHIVLYIESVEAPKFKTPGPALSDIAGGSFSPLTPPSHSLPVHCALSSWPHSWCFGKKMTTYVTKLCWTSLFLFESDDFGHFIFINLNYTMKNLQAKRMRENSLWANWVIVKCLLRMPSPVFILAAIGRFHILQTLLMFMFVLLRSCLSPFIFNRAVTSKTFAEEKEAFTVRHFFVCFIDENRFSSLSLKRCCNSFEHY